MNRKTPFRILALFMTAFMVFLSVPVAQLGLKASAADVEERYTVLVLDTSNSADFLDSNNEVFFTADTALSYVKTASERFLDNVAEANGNNYVAVVSFKDTATTISGFTQDFDTLKTSINNIYAYSETRDISAGLDAANALMNSVTDEDAIKNVVLFTTGMTNEGSYSYDGHYDESTIASNWRRVDTQIRLYAYANTAYDSAQALKDQGIWVYTIGLFQTMDSMPAQGRDVVEFFRLTAEDLATSSEYFHPVSDPENLLFTFEEIADSITSRKYHGTFRFPSADDHDFDGEYFFDEAYFSLPATQYQASLATMTLDFVLSAFGSNEANYSDKPKNAEALLRELEFEDITVTDTYRQRPTEDSMAVIAGHKDIEVNGETVTLIAASTRGGGYEAEWAGNFTVGSSGRHLGFNRAATIAKNFLSDYISAHKNEFQDHVKLWIGGYSRGAATANLTAADITRAGGIGGVTLEKNDIYAYCFEPPMGENIYNVSDAECRSLNNIHCIANPTDVVTKVAMRAWGFTRYGTYEAVIPSDITHGNYADQVDKMVAQYKALNTEWTNESLIKIDGKDAVISQSFQAIKLDPDVNLDVNFDPGIDVDIDLGHFETRIEYDIFGIPHLVFVYVPGHVDVDFDPQLDIDFSAQLITETNKSMAAFLDDLATDLAFGFANRVNYTEVLQPTVRPLIGQLMGNGNEAYKWKQVPDRFKQKLLDNIGNIAATLVFSGTEETEVLIACYLVESVLEAGIEIGGYLTADEALEEALNSVGRAVVAAILTSGTEDLLTLAKNGGMLFTCHYPELCLAWLQSKDPHFTDEDVRDEFIASCYRIVHINCPVDVYVYDANGNLVAAIVNNEPQEIEGSSIVAEYNSDGEKRIYLPAGDAYRVEIAATDEGTLNYSVSEFSYETNGNAKIVSYYDIPIQTGDRLTGMVGAFSDEDAEYTGDGSSVDYTLTKNGAALAADTVLYDEAAANALYLVTADMEQENYGNVLGGGVYTEGEFAQVSAVTFNGNEFEGWYEDGNLVSNEQVYRFRVENDRELTARFEGEAVDLPSAQTYSLNLRAEGGTATADPAQGGYLSGTEITLKATPAEGKVFVRWEAEAGSFADAASAETVFVMPAQTVTVQAVFADAESAQTDASVTTTTTTTVTTTTTTTTTTVVTTTTTAPLQQKNATAVKTGDTDTMIFLFLLLSGGFAAAGITIKRRKDAA